jgi:epoxyqueuosine reductase
LFAGSPIRRAGRDGFLRNVCVALGNRADATAVPALAHALAGDRSPLVRAHAAWALGAIAARHEQTRDPVRAALDHAGTDEQSDVREEVALAMQVAATGVSGSQS